MRYAQLNNNNICVAVSDLTGEVDAPHMIPIGITENPIGYTWDNGEWIAPPPSPGEDDPAAYPLLPWQFKVMVDVLGVDQQIRAQINQIPDVWQRAVALRRYLNASQYDYNDPLLQQISQAIGITKEQLEEHWMTAKDLSSSSFAEQEEAAMQLTFEDQLEPVAPIKVQKNGDFNLKE
jgi:hypothetical protein